MSGSENKGCMVMIITALFFGCSGIYHREERIDRDREYNIKLAQAQAGPRQYERNVGWGSAPEKYVEYPDGTRAYLKVDGKPIEQAVPNFSGTTARAEADPPYRR